MITYKLTTRLINTPQQYYTLKITHNGQESVHTSKSIHYIVQRIPKGSKPELETET